MIKLYECSGLHSALEKLKDIVKVNEGKGRRTVIFCEDRLTLAAERTVCSAVDGTFLTSVFTFARFLTAECGKSSSILSSRGSAMAIRRIIEKNKGRLKLFKKLASVGAAQSVYDTIALLYASGVSADDAKAAAESGALTGGKLDDIALIYSEYEKYLAENNLQDRNGYLKKLPAAIEGSSRVKGACAVFLGYQAFTRTALDCVGATMRTAADTIALVAGGDEDVYVNEASAGFSACAADFGGAEKERVSVPLCPEAEQLRRTIFNPESFFKVPPLPTSRVRVYEGADLREELEFAAACIKRQVAGGERYAKISVMLPELEKNVGALSGVFARYKIPYFADVKLSLGEHPLGSFILAYLRCALYGCLPRDVDAAVSSPLFPAERRAKDIFRNYMLRYGAYRGAVRRKTRDGLDKDRNYPKDAGELIENVRNTFLRGLDAILSHGVKSGICGGIRELLTAFNAEETLANQAKKYEKHKPLAAGFCARAYQAAMSVIDEAESISGGDMPPTEFYKLLQSGFAAMKMSIIPPKSDAVFVGDVTGTVNIGTNVVIALSLTGDVPLSGADTALLTDREISALESVNLNISPKISQVNARLKETAGLNICAFRKFLYLSRPAMSGGEECTESEMITYARRMFRDGKSDSLKSAKLSDIRLQDNALAFYCSEKLPALERLAADPAGRVGSTLYELLCRNGLKDEADAAAKKRVRSDISCGEKLHLKYGSLSPTALETYFSCPYQAFVRQGLALSEREEGAMQAVDTGNFIHAVLQELGKETGKYERDEFKEVAEKLAHEKLSVSPYNALADTKGGEYISSELEKEAVTVSLGMYDQLKNSSFMFSEAESGCKVSLSGGVSVYGRIDRIDTCGDMVRIIDYKTGLIDDSPSKYYAGAKLQLPLYLLSASEGKRPAGAYYFPAAVTYSDGGDSAFRLAGFMDGSEEVVRASDINVEEKKKSAYVDAYLNGRKLDSAMTREDFSDFLEYSRILADGAAREMIGGNISPSPLAGVCEYCKAGGSCGFALGKDGAAREIPSIKCAAIARISRIASGREEIGDKTEKSVGAEDDRTD